MTDRDRASFGIVADTAAATEGRMEAWRPKREYEALRALYAPSAP